MMKLSFTWMLMMGAGFVLGGCGAETAPDDGGQYGYVGPVGENGSEDPLNTDQNNNGNGEEVVDGEVPDGTDPNNGGTDPVDGEVDLENPNPGNDIDEPIFIEDLAVTDLEQIDVLRTTIFAGLDVGTEHYLEHVTLALIDVDIFQNYDGIPLDGWAILNEEVESCPFVKFYDPNPPAPTGVLCEQMVHLAKEQAKQELKSKLTSTPMPQDVLESELVDEDEAQFWYEQGALSGIEERAVLVEIDIQAKNLCEKNAPSAVESSYIKGELLGRDLMINQLNGWLAANGNVADYPVMSQPIEVCNANSTSLEPAFQDAVQSITAAVGLNPLCDQDYEPPTGPVANMYAQAKADYESGMKKGINNEFALAAVKIFKVIPCNVSDPLVVDLDGDGIELLPIHKGVNFDLWSSREQAMAWPSGDDGFLAMDRNGNGMIDNGSELFGNINGDYVDGFAQLAVLDTNKDGALTAEDDAFDRLVVWNDSDVNAKTSAGELLSMADLQIVSLPVQGRKVDLQSAGNPIPFVANAKTESGEILMGDAFLRTAPYPRLAFSN
jgi:hypothetical protein